jgi:hypothetical protein
MKAIALLIVLLVSPVFAQEKAGTNNPLWACGPATTKFDVKAAPPADIAPEPASQAGNALVYVIGDIGQGSECLGGCTTIRVGLDDAWAGANQGNTYFSFFVPPGEHHLCSNWQSSLARLSAYHSLANFTAEPGKVYYFRTRIWYSAGQPHLDIGQLNGDEGRYQVSTSTLAVSHPKK